MATKKRDALRELSRKLEVLKIEMVPIESVTPNTYNPNRQNPHDFELLLRSMREDGMTQPLLVQKATNEIVDGEHRWRAWRQITVEREAAGQEVSWLVPVVFVDMTMEQMRISTLRHNRARGSEDIDATRILLNDLRELGQIDWAKDELMMDDKELALFLDDSSVAEALAGEDFGQAWEPAGEHPSTVTVETTQIVGASQTVMQAATPDAIERMAKAEAAIAAAHGTERFQLQAARDIFRISLQFIGSEAEIVREVLGATGAAMKLIALCKKWEETHGRGPDETAEEAATAFDTPFEEVTA